MENTFEVEKVSIAKVLGSWQIQDPLLGLIPGKQQVTQSRKKIQELVGKWFFQVLSFAEFLQRCQFLNQIRLM